MFGTNQVIGKKFFKDAPKDSLFVTSIFFTLQGEGPLAGRPAVFVRLAKCNLDCSFCDTFFDDGDWMTYDQLREKIDATIVEYFWKRDIPLPQWVRWPLTNKLRTDKICLIMTGGEPLLQDNITNFLFDAEEDFYDVQIESNGILNTTIPPSTILVCSPKCSEKDGKPYKYLSPSPTILERADCLKFVMSADPSSPYHTIPYWALELVQYGKPIYCSPMNVYNAFPQKIKLLRAEKGTITLSERSTVDEIISWWEPGLLDMNANQANHEYTAQYCIENGLRFNMQMHLFASLA